MRHTRQSRFYRFEQNGKRRSLDSILLFITQSPIIVTKLAIIMGPGYLIATVVRLSPDAYRFVALKEREAMRLGNSDQDSTRRKGGEARQKGSERKGSLVRPGGPLSSDDLRRRLYELRALKQERKDQHTPKRGGQHGE
ncbi:MAG: hypothetical protein KDA93_27025 [Planctomycetaceae bacterium]|nr:hypothetical protein [Planctomycetaceae bacterium]